MSLTMLMTGAAAQAGSPNMPTRTLSTAQQTALLHYTELGLRWIKGDISFEDVTDVMGEPELKLDQPGKTQYCYYVDDAMAVYFIFNRVSEAPGGTSSVAGFRIEAGDEIETHIPYEQFDRMGLQRVVYGEKIDEARIERRDFFVPVGVGDLSHSIPINSVSFWYRLPVPKNSPYDIYAAFNYLAELVRETGPWDLSIVRQATNLRYLGIARVDRGANATADPHPPLRHGSTP